MSYRIEITDTKATLVGANGYGKEVKTSELLQSFQPPEMIPVSLRWYDPIREIYVFEYPPGHRIIHRDMRGDPFRIPVPWQVYICSTNPRNVRMYMRTEQLTSLDDILCHQFMSNIYRSGTPCQGPQGKVYKDDPLATCRAMIDAIWMTTFNGGCYISSEGNNMYGAAYKNETGALMPKEIVKAGYDAHFWAYARNEPSFHSWMEERSIEEVLSWTYNTTGSLRELIEFLAKDNGQGSPWDNVQNVFGRLNAKAVKK